jgi:hypothetical protein
MGRKMLKNKRNAIIKDFKQPTSLEYMPLNIFFIKYKK